MTDLEILRQENKFLTEALHRLAKEAMSERIREEKRAEMIRFFEGLEF